MKTLPSLGLYGFAKHQAQRGFSNVQIAIGILVGVIILLGSLGGYQYIVQAKVNNEISTIGDLKAATVRYGQFASPFVTGNVTAPILVGQNFFASAGLTVGGTPSAPIITNQWGGAVTVGVGTATTAGDSIAFTFNAVPNNACRELSTKLDNVAAKITINTTDTKAAGSPSNPATAATQCDATSDANVMIYTLQK